MRRRMFIPVAVLAFGLIGLWGYNQYVARALWENRVETQYQRAFNDLTQNLGGLETQLAKASVSASPRFLRQTMAEIWRLSYASQEKLGQLPLGSLELTRMKMLLAKVAAYSFRVTDRPGETLNLTPAEWKTLQGFRTQARYVSGELTSMQANILMNNLRWVDVDRLNGRRMTAAAMARNLGTNAVTKSLGMAENGLKRMPDPGFPESAVIFKPKPKGITGPRITQAQGRQVALKFLDASAASHDVSYLGKIKNEIGGYVFRVTPRQQKGNAKAAAAAAATRVSVTSTGGHVAWMLVDRPFGGRKLDLAKATAIAQKFARDKGLADMAVISREEFDRVDLITMCPKVGGVLYYPEMIKVQVAMDNGQVVGYEGVPYLTFHDPSRQPAPARLTAEQARQRVSTHLAVQNVRPCVIVDSRNREVMAYEVAGTMKGERFLVYLNATDGTEIKIRRVDANGVEID